MPKCTCRSARSRSDPRSSTATPSAWPCYLCAASDLPGTASLGQSARRSMSWRTSACAAWRMGGASRQWRTATFPGAVAASRAARVRLMMREILVEPANATRATSGGGSELRAGDQAWGAALSMRGAPQHVAPDLVMLRPASSAGAAMSESQDALLFHIPHSRFPTCSSAAACEKLPRRLARGARMTRIRRATPDDAEALSLLAAQTFTETFGHLYPQEDLHGFLEETYAVERARIVLAHPDYAIWLLEMDNLLVGHAAAGPCGLPHDDVRPGDGELKRLYLLKDYQNSGWGSRLFETALQWLERDGPRTLWIGVWSENFGAQRLYARYGFEKVGEYDFPVGKIVDREYILRHRPVLAAA
ncbi:Acetyltransferases [Xanthomonas oryzae pv. oryzae KACC 10331]|uniref:Acetyltransferases n=11 Tax=Xanthomonas oryzae TaxID=347 RepID=Q5H2B0_XANOR|nr:Acetyltransferases [Xanthomonas oryzae pv. oryzae KACC 10331]